MSIKSGQNLSDIRDMIRNAGLRCTASRTTVLKYLIDASAPLSHAELIEQFVPQGLDQATIYRNLVDLTDAGLLTRLELGDHVWRFEFRKDADHNDNEHPHFLCTACGQVSCLADIDIHVGLSKNISSMVGEICEVFIKGKCEQCV